MRQTAVCELVHTDYNKCGYLIARNISKAVWKNVPVVRIFQSRSATLKCGLRRPGALDIPILLRLCSRMTEHDHHHDHDHSELTETELRVRALETILTEKGYVDPAALDLLIETYETKVGPRNGARVVARAWSDPDYRARLLRDATPAIAELGYAGRQGEHIVAVENTPALHNMIVCTLCSCYPWPVLGLPPVWYKSAPYRSKAVKDPRGVLRDFGFELPENTEVRVWDSTAEIRYFVLPVRPKGSEGWSEERLAKLVTRDSMIGTGLPKQPQEVA